MTLPPPQNQWKTLDKDLGRIDRLEEATHFVARPLVAPGIALAFVVLAGVGAALFFGAQPGAFVVIAAAVIGAYMALNIGANDVANNMGPAVGANALTLGGALLIAAVFETAGALIAGGDVVKTISTGIVAPEAFEHSATFIWAMMAALLAAALWLNLATWLGAPVSTTHSIVGGVVGAGVAAAGLDAVNWLAIGRIAASWLISPVLGGVIAALFLALKGLSKVVKVDLATAMTVGAGVGFAAWLASVPLIRRQSEGLENRKKSLRKLFAVPLVISAALLSFAHGANDVANAVGPLAAIVHAVAEGDVGATKVAIPLWVMLIGAGGISFGLVLFGPKLIRMVGSEITKLNPMRAYCVALSAALTVIVASWLGLPVSSTHIAVGAVFGVGFFREWHAERRARALGLIKGKVVPPEERSRRKLVRRSHLIAVAAAWVITVPASAALSALVFSVLRLVA